MKRGVTPDFAEIEAMAKTASDQPIVMVNLMKFADSDGPAVFAEYQKVTSGIVRSDRIEVEILYAGMTGTDFSGAENWDMTAIVRYGSFADFARLMLHPDYREKATPLRNRALSRAVLMISTPRTSG